MERFHYRQGATQLSEIFRERNCFIIKRGIGYGSRIAELDVRLRVFCVGAQCFGSEERCLVSLLHISGNRRPCSSNRTRSCKIARSLKPRAIEAPLRAVVSDCAGRHAH